VFSTVYTVYIEQSRNTQLFYFFLREDYAMLAIKVENLVKHYPKFHLNQVSLELEQGYIMGFIGSNGAGKTTTLKSILNMIQIEQGTVTVLGQNFAENEIAIKQDMGYIFGEADYYTKSKIKKVTNVVKRFYTNWNEEVYYAYLKKFHLDENKKIAELSAGMRVKYALTLALSHEAKIFILDEPTSGLDPVARDGLLEIFQELVESGERSILFSTHITSDLDKCADYITFIQNGSIIKSSTKDDFISAFSMIQGPMDKLDLYQKQMISYKVHSFGFKGLIKNENLEKSDGVLFEVPNLEDIMIYYAKKEEDHEEFIV